MKSFLEEFKAFAIRGNVVDLAIAVVIGATFGKIVTSLVDDLFMPFVGYFTGGVDWSKLMWVLREASDATPMIAVKYGVFLNTIITFIIVAFATFMLIRQMNRFVKKEAAKPVEAPKPTREEELLVEIRDLLRSAKG
ncbi:MAG: large-conductance mechanosensitive channel protein MscL [Candidatus Pacebacteria bacterium]|nr:large-conductance mechanosensitive channel protein MscL [Candidatus Paceibacterota bacterium]